MSKWATSSKRTKFERWPARSCRRSGFGFGIPAPDGAFAEGETPGACQAVHGSTGQCRRGDSRGRASGFLATSGAGGRPRLLQQDGGRLYGCERGGMCRQSSGHRARIERDQLLRDAGGVNVRPDAKDQLVRAPRDRQRG